MIKYRATIMTFEGNSRLRPLALIASSTGIQDPATVGAADKPYNHNSDPLSWYASANYNTLREESKEDFLPTGLDIPFYSLMEANTHFTNMNSFEYWFSRWALLNFGVVFQKIQL